VKDLAESVDKMCQEFSEVQPSISEVLELRDEFANLADKTTGVIEQYESTLTEKDAEYQALLEDCRSQFKQVTNDVESLVSLEVNFDSIKDKIEKCLQLSNTIVSITEGPFVLMDGDDGYVPVEDRLSYKHYLRVVDSIDITTGTGGSGSGSGGDTETKVVYMAPEEVTVNPSVDIEDGNEELGDAYDGQPVVMGLSYSAK
jgi:hypothetical protein